MEMFVSDNAKYALIFNFKFDIYPDQWLEVVKLRVAKLIMETITMQIQEHSFI